MDSRSLSPISSTRLHGEVPFEELPNLPKPIIPKIDLGIKRIELEALLQIRFVSGLEYILKVKHCKVLYLYNYIYFRPSLESFKRIGHSVADHSTQTNESDILDLKYIIEMLRTLTLDTGKLRKDLTFAQSVLRANYEKQISDRSTELYVHIKFYYTDDELMIASFSVEFNSQLDIAELMKGY